MRMFYHYVSRPTWLQLGLLLLLLLMGVVLYNLFFGTLTFSPTAEAEAMQQLERTKQTTSIQPFATDGCSANVSKFWQIAVQEVSEYSIDFAESYADVTNIPFKQACIEHDRTYHAGEGGYVARLLADNQLRNDIIEYGITHADEIQIRASLQSTEEAIFLYELLAEVVYRGVRLGGAPCTGELYAWGFGYNGGKCESVP